MKIEKTIPRIKEIYMVADMGKAKLYSLLEK